MDIFAVLDLCSALWSSPIVVSLRLSYIQGGREEYILIYERYIYVLLINPKLSDVCVDAFGWLPESPIFSATFSLRDICPSSAHPMDPPLSEQEPGSTGSQQAGAIDLIHFFTGIEPARGGWCLGKTTGNLGTGMRDVPIYLSKYVVYICDLLGCTRAE